MPRQRKLPVIPATEQPADALIAADLAQLRAQAA